MTNIDNQLHVPMNQSVIYILQNLTSQMVIYEFN